ncbi:MAG: phenylacetate--CoA ligase family protein, partial [Bradyrhizobium sp.]
RSSLIPNQTGGSTGEPLRFYMDRRTVEYYEAARWRALGWYGVTQGSRCLMLWGNPIELDAQAQKKAARREQLLKNRRILSAYTLTPEKADEYLDLLRRYQPEYLYGYASALYTFAKIILDSGKKPEVRLKVAASTSESLFDYQRETIAKAFSCPVANEYGARDAGILAYECPDGGLHLSYENCVIELLDPVSLEPVETPGREGLIAVTDLNNFAQPRARYLIGDLAVWPEPGSGCTCGRPMPCLARVTGRETAMLLRPDGALVHGSFLNKLAHAYDTIRQIQLVQHTPLTATVRVASNDPQADYSELLRAVRETLPGVAVELEVVGEIAPSASGKLRYAIREFPLR